MISIELLTIHYGYLALIIGTMLEGETVLVIGGFLAYLGYLNFYLVIILAYAASVATDQAFFCLGRHKGQALIEKHRFLKRRFIWIHNLLEKHETKAIFLFRFLYGCRAAMAAVIGSSRIKTKKFFIVNAASGLVWSILFASIGYFVGTAAGAMIGRIKHFEKEIISTIIVLSALFWSVDFIIKRIKLAKSDK
ncbi:MAG: DedA family protein [Parcubacteria group bacterium]